MTKEKEKQRQRERERCYCSQGPFPVVGQTGPVKINTKWKERNVNMHSLWLMINRHTTSLQVVIALCLTETYLRIGFPEIGKHLSDNTMYLRIMN